MKWFDWMDTFPWATLGRRETPSELLRKIEEQSGRAGLLPSHPRLSLFVRGYSHKTLQSLLAQSYENWEAIVIGEGALEDDRIHYVKQFHLANATGDWVGVIDAKDVLNPAALFSLIHEAQVSECDAVYCHEAWLDSKGKKIDGYFTKAVFSAFNLWHFNPIGRLWLMKNSMVKKVGYSELGAEHELFLRASANGARFHLAPYFLYYRHQPPVRLSQAAVSKAAVETHLKRVGFSAKVSLASFEGEKQIKIHPKLGKKPKISTIICFKDRPDWTVKCIEHLAAQADGVELELILVDNASRPESMAKVKKVADQLPFPVKWLPYQAPFNFAHMNNTAVKRLATGDFLFLLNNDVFLQGERALSEMASWAQHDWVGTVGIWLRHQSGETQHGGFVADFGGNARLARVGHQLMPGGFTRESREVFGSTFAACMLKRSTYQQLGGLNELDFPNGFGDVAFSFECRKHNLKNLYLGHVEGIHLESGTRSTTYEYWEEFEIERRYPEMLQQMLRFDLGYDNVPAKAAGISGVFKEAILSAARENVTLLFKILTPRKT